MNIEQKIESYFRGETSTKEEQALRQYFMSEEMDEKFEKYAPFFLYIEEKENERLPENVKKNFAKNAVRAHSRKDLRKWWYLSAGVASISAIFVALSLFMNTPSPDLAYQSYAVIHGEMVTAPEVIERYVTEITGEIESILAESKEIADSQNEMLRELGFDAFGDE